MASGVKTFMQRPGVSDGVDGIDAWVFLSCLVLSCVDPLGLSLVGLSIMGGMRCECGWSGVVTVSDDSSVDFCWWTDSTRLDSTAIESSTFNLLFVP